jgi:hypothetical protein
MKIKEFLGESATDIVARFYKEASKDAEKFYNPENVKYKEKNTEYYNEHFKEWFAEEITPVFMKPSQSDEHPFTNIPKEGKLQSPGYRGLQLANFAAGNPYDHKFQRYEPSATRMLASQTMDTVRNSNGQ